MTEAQLQSRVVYRAKKTGWKIAHAGRGVTEGGWVTQMAPGWPDLFLLRPPRALAIELKRELAEPTPEQVDYLQMMNLCGIAAIIVRPSDLREGRVNAVLR